MANTKKYVQLPTSYLSGSGVIIGAVNIVVNTFVDIYGNTLTMADFGDTGYGTIEPDTNNEESFTFTSITPNANGTTTLGGVSSTIAKSPYTAASGLVRQHSGGTKVVVSDTAAFWNTFANKANDETITGLYTFPNTVNRPVLAADTDTANAAGLVTLGQLSRQAISGASNASTAVKGIVQLPTQAQVDSKTTTGSTGALLALTPDKQRSTLLSDYVVDTGAANAYVITPVPAITAYTVGQVFSFKAVNANTTASNININGLGVKTIKKNDGATDLVANDIKAGQLVVIEYDGTNFLMISPSGLALNSNGSGASLTGITALKTTRLAGYSPASNTSENTVFTTTITGGLLSTTGMIRIRVPVYFATNATAETWTIRLKYGGTTLFTNAVSCGAVGGGTAIGSYGFIDAYIINSGATNTQNVGYYITLAPQLGTAPTNPATATAAHSTDTTSAIDTTSNQTLAMTVQRTNGAGGSGTFYQTVIETNYNG